MIVPVPPPAPGPVRVKVAAVMRAEPPGTVEPLLMVILTVCADVSVRVSVKTIDSIQWPATKLVPLKKTFLLPEVKKVAELLVVPGTFDTIESPLSVTVMVPVLVLKVPVSPVKLFCVTDMVTARTPRTIPPTATSRSDRAGTLLALTWLSVRLRLFIAYSLAG